MKTLRMVSALILVGVALLVTAPNRAADAQGQTIKIGVLFDHTGPFAAGGSLNCWRGAKMMIDYINEKGGVLGQYKIVQGLEIDDFSRARIDASVAELVEERDTVQKLGLI